MSDISASGVYFDTKANKVVESPPEEGVQLVAPGGEITSAVQADIDRWRDVEMGVVSEPGTVTTEAVSSAESTSAKSSKKA